MESDNPSSSIEPIEQQVRRTIDDLAGTSTRAKALLEEVRDWFTDKAHDDLQPLPGIKQF